MNVRKLLYFVTFRNAQYFIKDVNSIYQIPALLKSQGLDDFVCERFRLTCPEADLSEWEQVLYKQANPVGEVTIGMVVNILSYPMLINQ